MNQKTVPENIYAILLMAETNNANTLRQLDLQRAFSLEEAIAKSHTLLITKLSPGITLMNVRAELYAYLPIADFFTPPPAPIALSITSEVNELIKKIIQTKDTQLFEQSKGRFTAEEIKLIQDNLKIIWNKQ